MAASEGSERRTKQVFLLAALLHALSYFFALAPWMGEDEPWHFEYASHVASGHLPWGGGEVVYGPEAPRDDRREWSASALQTYRRFHGLSHEEIAARQSEILASMVEHDYFRRVDWAGASAERSDFDEIEPMFTAAPQSAGYYLVLGTWLALWPGDSIESALLWGRVLSLVFYMVTAWAAWEFAHSAFSDRWLAIAAAVAIAWFPMSVRQAAVVNNDVLARTIGALVLMLVARGLRARDEPDALRAKGFDVPESSASSWRRELRSTWILAALIVVLGLLVKTTTAGLVVVLLVALMLRSKVAENPLRIAVFAAGALTVLALVVWLWHSQHSPVLPRNVEAFVRRVTRGFTLQTFANVGKSLIGAFNWFSREMSSTTYVVFGVVGATAFVSSLFALLETPRNVSRPILLVCFVAVATQLVLIVLRGVGHGRYLMPVWPALAMLVVVGLVARVHPYWRPRVAGLFVFAFALYDALFLWGGLVPNEYLVWGS